MTKALIHWLCLILFCQERCMTKACDSLVVPHTFLSGGMYD